MDPTWLADLSDSGEIQSVKKRGFQANRLSIDYVP